MHRLIVARVAYNCQLFFVSYLHKKKGEWDNEHSYSSQKPHFTVVRRAKYIDKQACKHQCLAAVVGQKYNIRQKQKSEAYYN